MPTVGVPLDDILIVRDGANAPVIGLTAGDFATLEAYRVAAPATTAAVTLAEVGGGEYRATFTPSAAGAWVLHAVYEDAPTFVEALRRYEVVAAASVLAVAAGQPYLTVEEFKARTRSATAANDDAIAAVLLAASDQVGRYCRGRRGGTFAQSEPGTVRYVTAPRPTEGWWRDGWPPAGWPLAVPDLVSVSELATGDGATWDTVWATDEYDLGPWDAPEREWPYTTITPVGGKVLPVAHKGVRITGVWGWPAVPAPVREATYLIANRLKSLWDAPFGQSGGSEFGGLNMTGALDPVIRKMLEPFRVRPV